MRRAEVSNVWIDEATVLFGNRSVRSLVAAGIVPGHIQRSTSLTAQHAFFSLIRGTVVRKERSEYRMEHNITRHQTSKYRCRSTWQMRSILHELVVLLGLGARLPRVARSTDHLDPQTRGAWPSDRRLNCLPPSQCSSLRCATALQPPRDALGKGGTTDASTAEMHRTRPAPQRAGAVAPLSSADPGSPRPAMAQTSTYRVRVVVAEPGRDGHDRGAEISHAPCGTPAWR
jgi:hypothetical protein